MSKYILFIIIPMNCEKHDLFYHGIDMYRLHFVINIQKYI